MYLLEGCRIRQPVVQHIEGVANHSYHHSLLRWLGPKASFSQIPDQVNVAQDTGVARLCLQADRFGKLHVLREGKASGLICSTFLRTSWHGIQSHIYR